MKEESHDHQVHRIFDDESESASYPAYMHQLNLPRRIAVKTLRLFCSYGRFLQGLEDLNQSNHLILSEA